MQRRVYVISIPASNNGVVMIEFIFHSAQHLHVNVTRRSLRNCYINAFLRKVRKTTFSAKLDYITQFCFSL